MKQIEKEAALDNRAQAVFKQCPAELCAYYALQRHRNRQHMLQYQAVPITEKPEIIARNLEYIDQEQQEFAKIMNGCDPCVLLKNKLKNRVICEPIPVKQN